MNVGPKYWLLYSSQPLVYKQILSKLMTFQIASKIGYFVYRAKLKMLIC